MFLADDNIYSRLMYIRATTVECIDAECKASYFAGQVLSVGLISSHHIHNEQRTTFNSFNVVARCIRHIVYVTPISGLWQMAKRHQSGCSVCAGSFFPSSPFSLIRHWANAHFSNRTDIIILNCVCVCITVYSMWHKFDFEIHMDSHRKSLCESNLASRRGRLDGFLPHRM